MNERDELLLRVMLQTNSQWIVTTHRGHVTAIRKVGEALDTIPTWWLKYFDVNRIKYGPKAACRA